MNGNPRIQELLEEILDSERTPEEVCADCPELLPEIRKGLKQFSRIMAKVDALFVEPSPTLLSNTKPEALRHFLNGEPIEARPINAIERSSKWVRSKPAQAVLLAGSVLLTIALVVGGLWFMLEQKAVSRGVQDDLQEVAQMQQESSWTVASAALERARIRLGSGGGYAEFRHEFEQGISNLKFIAQLAEIRSIRADRNESAEATDESAKRYEATFHERGLGGVGDNATTAGLRIAASNIRVALLAAVDDWQDCNRSEECRQWLADVALAADSGQKIWRSRIRERQSWNDVNTVKQIAEMALKNKGSVGLLLLLGKQLFNLSRDHGISYLQRVQLKHSDDFWANITTGDVFSRKAIQLMEATPDDKRWFMESMRYYQTALGIRPTASMANNKIGGCLKFSKRIDEALDYIHESND